MISKKFYDYLEVLLLWRGFMIPKRFYDYQKLYDY